MFRFFSLILWGLLLTIKPLSAQQQVKILTVPGEDHYCNIDPTGASVLPSGRLVTPAGNHIRITHDPFGLAVSPDGDHAVTLHNGVMTVINTRQLGAIRVPSYDGNIKSPFSNGSFLGVAIGNDSRTVYLSGGDNGAVIIYDIIKFKRLDSISLNGIFGGIKYEDSFTSDLIYNKKENELLVLDRGNFRLVRISLITKKITASVPVGRQPFGLAISPDHTTAFVANVGMYAYPLIEGMDSANYNKMLIPWHPYGNNTKESIEGTEIMGRKIPGVGSPHAPEAMSVYTVDLATNKVSGKYKTGFQIGEIIDDAEVTGGASPNSIAVGNKYAYITNATNDNISILDHKNHKLSGIIQLRIDQRIDKYRGYLPFGIELSPDEKTLYVALLGLNAVAVVDIASKKTIGLIPTGWGSSRVKLSPDNKKLYITSCRGLGAGPNGGKDFHAPVQGTYVGDIQLASFQQVDIPDQTQLKKYTQQVINNTFKEKSVIQHNIIPATPHKNDTPIKYIVYVTKENRTYDEIFGQLKTGKGDSSLARYGLNVTISGKNDSVLLQNADVMPNHTKLAKEFACSDNFYCDSDASIHGHHWMMGVIPNEWVEANSSTDKTAKYFSSAPGRRYPASTGSMDPEDYAERGGLWEAMERSKISFYNFGEANETAHVREDWNDTLTGAAHGVMVPMQKALYHCTSHNYAGYNTNIPDQFRLDQFEKEFTAKWIKGKEKMPQLITLQLPNDHGAGIRPADGYPYVHSYMADNDLALGRLISFLSHTSYWKNMLIIVTEDDPQGGVDHIDAHRSVLLMISPYVKRNYISNKHGNFGAILKLIYNIHGVPYVNQYDATATLLDDFFTTKPDYTPYDPVMADLRVFNPEISLKKYQHGFDWKKIPPSAPMDDEKNMRKDHYNK